MAEMTAAQAIEVLHNNQYQKHIGNGDYDYIHPLIDTEAKGIESLIQQQAQEIERLNGCLNFEQHYLGRVGTHADGCYKWGPGHWECAVREIERLNQIVDLARIVIAYRKGEQPQTPLTHSGALDKLEKYFESEVVDK